MSPFLIIGWLACTAFGLWATVSGGFFAYVTSAWSGRLSILPILIMLLGIGVVVTCCFWSPFKVVLR